MHTLVLMCVGVSGACGRRQEIKRNHETLSMNASIQIECNISQYYFCTLLRSFVHASPSEQHAAGIERGTSMCSKVACANMG